MKELTVGQLEQFRDSKAFNKSGSYVYHVSQKIDDLAAGKRLRRFRRNGERGGGSAYSTARSEQLAVRLVRIAGYKIKAGNDRPAKSKAGAYWELAAGEPRDFSAAELHWQYHNFLLDEMIAAEAAENEA